MEKTDALITINWTEGRTELSERYENYGTDLSGFAQFVAEQQADIADREGGYCKCEVTVRLRDGSSFRFRSDISRDFTTLRGEVKSRIRNYQSIADTGRLPCGFEASYMKREDAQEHADQFRAVLEALDAPHNGHSAWCAQFLGL